MKRNVWIVILMLIPYLLFPIDEDQYQKNYMNKEILFQE